MENPVKVFTDVYKTVGETVGLDRVPFSADLVSSLANVALNLTALELQWQQQNEATKPARRVVPANEVFPRM